MALHSKFKDGHRNSMILTWFSELPLFDDDDDEVLDIMSVPRKRWREDELSTKCLHCEKEFQGDRRKYNEKIKENNRLFEG